MRSLSLLAAISMACALGYAAPNPPEEAPKIEGKPSPFLVQRFKTKDAPRAMAFLPDNRTLLAAGLDCRVDRWDAGIGKLILSMEAEAAPSKIMSLAVFKDGKQAAAGAADGSVLIYDLDKNRRVQRLTRHEDWVHGVHFSDDGKKLLSASDDGSVLEWDLSKGEARCLFKHGEGKDVIRDSALVPGRDRFAVVRKGRTVIDRGDFDTNMAKEDFATFEEGIHGLALSPDGKQLAVGTGNQLIFLIDLEKGTRTHLWGKAVVGTPPESAVMKLAFTANGHRLLAGDSRGQVRLFDPTSKQLLRTLNGHQFPISALTISPDGRWAASADVKSHICVWDIGSGLDSLRCAGHTSRVNGVSYSEKENWILTAGHDKTARLWDAATGKPLQIFDKHDGKVNVAMFVEGGKQVLTAGHDKTPRIWDVRGGKLLGEFIGHTEPVHCAAVSENGKHLLTGAGRMEADLSPGGTLIARDCTARLWNHATRQPLMVFEGHAEPIMGVAFIANGSQIVTAGLDQTVRRWDVKTGEELERMDKHIGDITAFAVAPDESKVVTVDIFGTFWTWDLARGVAIRDFETEFPLIGKKGDFAKKRVMIRGLAFSPDGKRLMYGVEGGAVIRDAATGKLLSELTGVDAQVCCVAYAPDGKSAYTGGTDKLVRRWDLASK